MTWTSYKSVPNFCPPSPDRPFRLVKRDAIEVIVRRSKMGDWFLLYMLGDNIDTVIFRDIMQDLSNKLNTNQHHHVPGMKGQIQDA